MYSVVVLMALTTQAETPEFGRRGGCCGCYGGCYSSCYGGYSSCHGCYGGYSSYGCYGGYGCSGYTSYYSGCHGCYGGAVYSGCYGGAVYSGCYGGAVSYSGCCGGMIITPATPKQKQDGKQKDKEDDTTAVRPDGKAAARLVVTLPAEAKLTIDDEPTKATSNTRVFITPPLEPGKAYHYTLKATVPVGGKTEVITRTVQVIPGQETRETLTLPQSPVSATSD